MSEFLKGKGSYPKDELEVLLRLGEEVGEVFELVREKQSKRDLSYEIVDVLWNLLNLCELEGIDLETAFMEKLKINEERTAKRFPTQ